MTMQVSKGEFDRRVKLLEQKVKESTNSLIARLQAESEAFIEQLKNTQLDVNSLREQVEEIGFNEQKLDDLISSYNNFKANTLRINDVFDTDGQFDGSKIRPLSIETAALSVGQRSQQLSLSGIEFKLDPYSTSGGGILYWKSTSNNSTISSSNIAGIMFHYGYGTETNPKIYKIMEGQYPNTGQSWNTSKGYYIYAKIKKGSSTTAIYTEPTTVTKEYFDGYFEMLYYSNHTKVYNNTLPLFDSSADYYIYVNNKYEKITITNSNFRKNLVGLYKKSGDLYQLVLQDQPVYSSSATYCTKKDETLPEENSSSSSYNGETVIFNNVATIVVTTDKFTYDGTNQTSGGTSDTGYFYIQLGYVSVELNKGTTNNPYYRKVDMTYGSTTINGRLITTGRIEGTTGTNPAYFDLDAGEIGGSVNKITVGSGSSTAGMMKDGNSNIAIWSGTETPSFDSTPIWITRGGKAKFGNIGINNSNDDAIGFYNYIGGGTSNPGSFLIRKDGTGYFGDLNINTNGHLLSTKKTIATNTPLFYINNDGTARFGDILLNNNSLSFNTSPISLNASNFDFSKPTYEGIVNSNIQNGPSNYSKYFTVKTSESNVTVFISLKATVSGGNQFALYNNYDSKSPITSPVSNGGTLYYVYNSTDTNTKSIWICPYPNTSATSITVSNYTVFGSIRYFKNGVNIYNNGIVISDGSSGIFFGISGGSMHCYTLNAIRSGVQVTGYERKDFVVQ